jgi:carbamate kinase
MRIVIALGGNALLRRGERPDAAVQRAHLVQAAPALASAARDHELVIVHGNGPQVGLLALESATDGQLSGPYPFDELVAETQGLIGYLLQQTLLNAGSGPISTLVSQVIVYADDPAFDMPTKFVGATYTHKVALALQADRGWSMKPDTGGWRRVVASPVPRRIVELPAAENLLNLGTSVVLAGGGGVPVIEGPHGLEGVEAVVDKDLTAAVVAIALDADLFVILTDVEAVMADFGTPNEHPLGEVTIGDLERQDWAAGSIAPKVHGACHFVRETGGVAAIGSLERAAAVIAGTSGTRVRAERRP